MGSEAEGLWPLLAPQIARWEETAPADLAGADALDALDAPLLAHLDRHREPLARWLEEHTTPPGGAAVEGEPAEALARLEVRWLQSYNQFLDLGDESRRALVALGRRALREAGEALRQTGSRAELGAALAAVSAGHRAGVTRLYTALRAALPGEDQAVGAVVRCAEYSPALQLSLLGLDADTLAGPVLDLGCGEQALLVEHLRARGVEAFGVDRAAPPGPHVEARDWFAASLPRDRWGTVISHLGFSHHFMFHHLRGGPQAARYARRYMEVLQSLKPGGAFVYAPGLPFLEPLLPAATYRVTRRPIAGVEASGGVAPYACRVERIERVA
ncbi:MAG: class I SAM-dependent methyltransferase [Myxococcales bacterium]|nr:MAG: class I SAM-dependent methyltransferase [Myxococcales bacterium]